jgi:hypothetical protein
MSRIANNARINHKVMEKSLRVLNAVVLAICTHKKKINIGSIEATWFCVLMCNED